MTGVAELGQKVAKEIRNSACETEFECADIAIVATIQGLIEMELPLLAIEAAESAQAGGLPNHDSTFIPEVDSFRAILLALKPLFEKND